MLNSFSCQVVGSGKLGYGAKYVFSFVCSEEILWVVDYAGDGRVVVVGVQWMFVVMEYGVFP